MAALTVEELQAFLQQAFPGTTMQVASVGHRCAQVRQPISAYNLRPGETISGPTMMGLADTATYMAILAEIGIVPLAVTTNLNISFMQKPVANCALLADASLLKLGKHLAVAEVRIASESTDELVAHAQVTHSMPPSSA